MYTPIRILTVEREDDFGLIVTFSDGTSDGYVIEELLKLRPHRQPVIAECKLGLASTSIEHVV